ncbi:MAG: Exodeoxyribonuclease 7 large subunit [Candidatus Ordinivivax streblomastigis]|uniref:Exodeoxyribonuclease 7 large subunit n=1 Tax=Candidatus Ordinivivax streblomastigis TaxID=2540710 RepID=A0A5M8P537_9BACT|nr:MAG: Exodeoxyribonuclease 7 large subunit [Candidatus Ordinivivax streblomastigis]KAA6303330.1 MAG: Exodeoxyribonuclease 7 large subunit [Candidatus Ordinivivax streblomastigis]
MEYLTLSQLNTLVSTAIKQSFPETYWLMAETSDVRYNTNGHCYLEFIEKRASDNSIIAKARGYIWNNTFQLLKPYFEQQTGQNFVSGLKVLVKAGIDFHPVYGYGLSVYDIDPAYTLGDMQQQRQKILQQLEQEGVLSLNKELEMPSIPQRIAVITSPTAAGYEDFLDHLQKNPAGFVFYPHLFPAIMQGEQTEQSIISALDKIYTLRDQFDAVIIIRGGGATSDLASFDTYNLAVNVAQFPLPVITGIGHERDDTVLDFVAHHRAKTPTAVADYLIHCLEDVYAELSQCQSDVLNACYRMLNKANEKLQQFSHYLPQLVGNKIEQQQSNLQSIRNHLLLSQKQRMQREILQLQAKEAFFKLSSPQYILSKGYSITMKNGKAVKSAQSLCAGDRIETLLSEGKISSTVL